MGVLSPHRFAAMIKLKAIRPLSGTYGDPNPGDEFHTDEETAESLEARGLACRVREPIIETPVVERTPKAFAAAPENKARRHGSGKYSK